MMPESYLQQEIILYPYAYATGFSDVGRNIRYESQVTRPLYRNS
jgi:hypothetical protein